MKDWQLDVIRDQMDTEAWRKLNEPDPCEKQLKTASVSIQEATYYIGLAVTRLADAMVEVFETPMETKIGSFTDQLEDMKCDLNILAKAYGRGERE